MNFDKEELDKIYLIIYHQIVRYIRENDLNDISEFDEDNIQMLQLMRKIKIDSIYEGHLVEELKGNP